MRRFWILLLLLTGGLAAADPLLPPEVGPAPEVPAAFAQDARLDTRVTLRLTRRPLARAVAEVARQTGVRLTVARGVAEEPAILFCRKQPAKEVLHHLALLFDYRWSRTGEPGSYRYELYQDARAKRAEQERRDRD